MRHAILWSVLFLGLSAFGQGTVRRVDTLAQLLAINPATVATSTNLSYEVGGYTVSGDWGAPRTADWVSAGGLTTNTVCVFAATSGQWRFRDCENGVIDVRYAGAQPDDGVDDYAAIQAALDAAVNVRNKELLIPGGVFDIATTLTNRGASITGVGWRPQGSWLKWVGETNGYIMNIGAGTTTVGVTISKIGFQGNYVGNGIFWHRGGNSTLVDCRVDGPREMGVYFTNSVNMTVVGNRFTYGYATNTILVGTVIGSGHMFVANVFTGEGRGLVNMGSDGGTLQVIGNSFGPLFSGVERQDSNYQNGGTIFGNYFEFCYAGSVLVGVTKSNGMGTNEVASTNRLGSLLISGNELGIAHGGAINPTVIIDNANNVTISDNEIWALVTVTTNANNIVVKDNQLLRTDLGYGDYSIGAKTLYFSDGYDSGNTNKITTGYWQLGYQGAMRLSAPFWADQTVDHGPKLEFGGTYTGSTNSAKMWSRLEFNAYDESLGYFPGGSMTASVLTEGGSGTWLPMWHARPRLFELLCPTVTWTNLLSGPRVETLFGLSATWASENSTVGIGNTNAQFRAYGTDTTAVDRGGMIQFGGRVVGTTTNWPWAEVRGMANDSTTTNFPGGELQMWARDSALNWRKAAEFTPTRVDLLKPVIPPKLTTAEIAALTSIETGLLLWHIESSEYEYYDGANFVALGSGGTGPTNGTAIQVDTGSFMTTADIQNSAEIDPTRTSDVITWSIITNSIAGTKLAAALDLSAQTSVRHPQGTSPSLTLAGMLGFDTDFTGASRGIFKFHDGTEELAIAAFEGDTAAQYEVLIGGGGSDNPSWGLLSTNSITAGFYSWLGTLGGSSYTFTNGVTNASGTVSAALAAGSNISITNNNGLLTISAVTSTNSGTVVSVDGGSAMATANFIDNTAIGFIQTGNDVTATIIDSSISTNKFDSTAYNLLIDTAGAYVRTAGDTMTGELFAPTFTAEESPGSTNAGSMYWSGTTLNIAAANAGILLNSTTSYNPDTYSSGGYDLIVRNSGNAKLEKIASSTFQTANSVLTAYTTAKRPVAVWEATSFKPITNSTAAAIPAVRGNGFHNYTFSGTVNQSVVMYGIVPSEGNVDTTGGFTVHITTTATSTSNAAVFEASVMAHNTSTDVDSDSYDTAATVTINAPGTSGFTTVSTISLSNIDSLTYGVPFTLKLQRLTDNGSDTDTGTWQVYAVRITED